MASSSRVPFRVIGGEQGGGSAVAGIRQFANSGRVLTHEFKRPTGKRTLQAEYQGKGPQIPSLFVFKTLLPPSLPGSPKPRVSSKQTHTPSYNKLR